MRGGFCCEVLIAARRVAKELCHARNLCLGRSKAAVEVALEHHAKIEGVPPLCVRTHLLFPLVEVVAGVRDFLAQELAPRRRVTRAADQRRTHQVVRLAIMAFTGERMAAASAMSRVSTAQIPAVPIGMG